ncbi:MAG: hypothetical protein IJM50_01110 [Lachnospiraceae bacterium]|nr:hypothetical protein [Lachnospiraceae bacterium]
MKRTALLLASVLLVFTMAACGKNNDPAGSSANGNTPGGNGSSPAGTESNAPDQSGGAQNGDVQHAMVPGTLNFVNLKDGETPVLKALRLDGNLAGEGDRGDGKGFNYKPASTEDIRAIFELNEWVSVYPETEKADLGLWVFTHREDQSSYKDLTLSDVVAGYVTFVDLARPEDPENPWGEFYLNPAEVKDGFFDLVFTVNAKPVATLLTRFYNENELTTKTDAELEQIQKGLAPLEVK